MTIIVTVRFLTKRSPTLREKTIWTLGFFSFLFVALLTVDWRTVVSPLSWLYPLKAARTPDRFPMKNRRAPREDYLCGNLSEKRRASPVPKKFKTRVFDLRFTFLSRRESINFLGEILIEFFLAKVPESNSIKKVCQRAYSFTFDSATWPRLPIDPHR